MYYTFWRKNAAQTSSMCRYYTLLDASRERKKKKRGKRKMKKEKERGEDCEEMDRHAFV